MAWKCAMHPYLLCSVPSSCLWEDDVAASVRHHWSPLALGSTGEDILCYAMEYPPDRITSRREYGLNIYHHCMPSIINSQLKLRIPHAGDHSTFWCLQKTASYRVPGQKKRTCDTLICALVCPRKLIRALVCATKLIYALICAPKWSAHTSVGAHMRAHMSLGAQMSAHASLGENISIHMSALKSFGGHKSTHTSAHSNFGSTYKRSYMFFLAGTLPQQHPYTQTH